MEPVIPAARFVADPGPALLAHAREVYDGAFPPDLRADFDSLFADEVLVYAADDRTAAGLVVMRRLGSTGMVFVRYFVAGVRGSGVGSRMWHDLRARLGPDVRVVLDVEHPGEPGTAADEVVVRRRRVAFYERLGLVVLPVRDYAPPHDDGHAPPMLLLATDPRDPRLVVETVLHHRYGLSPADPRVEAVLRTSDLLPPA